MLNKTFSVIFKHRELNKESSGLDLLLKGSDDNCEKYHLFKRKPRRISLLLLRPVCSVGLREEMKRLLSICHQMHHGWQIRSWQRWTRPILWALPFMWHFTPPSVKMLYKTFYLRVSWFNVSTFFLPYEKEVRTQKVIWEMPHRYYY